MNNKRGGVGAKILIVLILMIASAIGGAYGYRVLDGKMAARDAKKDIEMVRLSDYDTAEAATVQDIIDKTTKDIETAKTRKDVYEIMSDFQADVAKVQTKAQKELEEARREAEEARNSNRNNNNNNNNNNNSNNNNYNNNGNDYNDDNSYNGNNTDNNSNSGSYDEDYDTNSNSGSSNSNNSSDSGSNAITNDDGTSGRQGLLGSLLGGND